MVLAWDKLQEVFVMLVVVVVLPHWRFFVHCFLTLSLILPWAIAGFLQQFCNFSPADAFIWTFLGFSVTVLPRLLPHTLVRFCDSDADRDTPSRILLCACPHRVVPSGWRMILNYLYCRYRTIGLSIAPVSHEACTCSKTIKTLWTRLVNKYCLKLFQRNCFLSIHQS